MKNKLKKTREVEKQKYRNENVCLPETPSNFLAGRFFVQKKHKQPNNSDRRHHISEKQIVIK